MTILSLTVTALMGCSQDSYRSIKKPRSLAGESLEGLVLLNKAHETKGPPMIFFSFSFSLLAGNRKLYLGQSDVQREMQPQLDHQTWQQRFFFVVTIQ